MSSTTRGKADASRKPIPGEDKFVIGHSEEWLCSAIQTLVEEMGSLSSNDPESIERARQRLERAQLSTSHTNYRKKMLLDVALFCEEKVGKTGIREELDRLARERTRKASQRQKKD